MDQAVSQRSGLVKQGPLYYVSLTVYVSLSVYLLPKTQIDLTSYQLKWDKTKCNVIDCKDTSIMIRKSQWLWNDERNKNIVV